jgi:bifunctional aspartokinase / homoserine dehydrogenase 1
MPASKRAPLEVWKFGGASLADAEAFRRAAGLIRSRSGPLVIVASAMFGITDLLLDGARRAVAGDSAAGSEVAEEFLKRHAAVIRELLPAGRERKAALLAVETMAREYREVAQAVAALAELSPRASDALAARGERASSTILAAVLAGAGRKAQQVDAVGFLMTDGHHGAATPDIEGTRALARPLLLGLLKRGVTPVVPGFIGRAADGSVATLGRGGSDLTATLLVRVLGASSAVLWKDVPGILTADPKAVPDARLVPQLQHREAAEVAYFGAKVLHPRALIPLDGTRATLVVRSFLHPDRPGTEVSARRTEAGFPVKAVATVRGQALVTVAGRGMMGVPGIAARTFAAVHAEGLSVSTIFQASSESSIGFTLADAEAKRAVTALHRAFKEELQTGLIDGVGSRSGLAVMAVVGNGMAGTPGIAARVFTALAVGGVNVIAIAQGSSELNISFVVSEAQAAEAARRVHGAFQLSKIGGGRTPEPERTDVVFLGFGRVGRALADQVSASGGTSMRVVGLLDRSGCVFDQRGLSRKRLLRLAKGKDEGQLLASIGGRAMSASDALHWIGSHAVHRPVLVDVTAEETGDLLLAALYQGFDLVLANKKPLAGTPEKWERLFAAASAAGRRIRYEATVGAGLPIIDTSMKLAETGDRIQRVEGCVSGTLGYVLSAVCDGRPFSEAVREAVAKGYAEPDPREDLSGRDAGRKGLILGRLIGYKGPAPVAEDLVPPSLRKVPLAQFLKQMSTLDADWKARVDRAAAKGRVLRYVVTATPRQVTARLIEVDVASPIGSLRGTRNLISFTTARYAAEPLVVMGPGAGTAVTAAGILNDIQYLAAT